MEGAVLMALVVAVLIGIAGFLVGTLIRSIKDEAKSPKVRMWKISAGRDIAGKQGIGLHIHAPDGSVRDSVNPR